MWSAEFGGAVRDDGGGAVGPAPGTAAPEDPLPLAEAAESGRTGSSSSLGLEVPVCAPDPPAGESVRMCTGPWPWPWFWA